MTGVLVLMTARVVVLLALRRDRDTDKGRTPPTMAGTRGDLAEPGSQLHAEIQTNDAVNNVLYERNALRQSGLAPWDAPVAGPGRGRTAPKTTTPLTTEAAFSAWRRSLTRMRRTSP